MAALTPGTASCSCLAQPLGLIPSGAAARVEDLGWFTAFHNKTSCCWHGLHHRCPRFAVLGSASGQAAQLWASPRGAGFNLCSRNVGLAVGATPKTLFVGREEARHIHK